MATKMVAQILDKTNDLLKKQWFFFAQLYCLSFKTQGKTLYIILLFINDCLFIVVPQQQL